MIYLIIEILLYLIVAALIGGVLGWVLRGASANTAVADEHAATWSVRMSGAAADHEAKLAAAEATNARLRADLHAANTRVGALEADGGRQLADIQQRLTMQARAAEALAAERGQALEQSRNAFNTAQFDFRGRLSAADAENARLLALLEAADARAATPAADPEAAARLEAIEQSNKAQREVIQRLEGSLAAAEALAADRAAQLASLARIDAPPADSGEADGLRARIAELEAALASAPLLAPPARAPKKPRVMPHGEDDLQAIPGIGPVLEKSLKAQGVLTYRTLAAMTPDEAKALGARMRNTFGDRFARDRWAEQARTLHQAKYGEGI